MESRRVKGLARKWLLTGISRWVGDETVKMKRREVTRRKNIRQNNVEGKSIAEMVR